MGSFLLLNGWEIEAPLDEQEKLILGVASGEITLPRLSAWIERHIRRSETGV